MMPALQRLLPTPKTKKSEPVLEVGSKAMELIAGEVDAQVHMHSQFARAGGATKAYVLPLSGKSSFAFLMDDGREWTLALTRANQIELRKAAPQMAALLPAGAIITAPRDIAESVSEAWEKLHALPAQLKGEDTYYAMGKDIRLPVVPPHIPLVKASELGRDVAASEMAFIWMSVYRNAQPASAFAKLLETSDALLWRRQVPAESFQIFTPLTPQHILIGASCGTAMHMPYLFSSLAHHAGKVGVIADNSDQAKASELKAGGFEARQRLATYKLG